MASPRDRGAGEPRRPEQHNWPGERNPSQWDVHDAYEVPEVSFLRRFKAALLLSEDAIDCHPYLTRIPNAEVVEDSGQQYTYPMAILSDLPPPPDSHTLDLALAQFSTTFKRHIFLSTLAFPAPPSKNSVPPYLEIAFACLAHVTSKSMPNSEDLGSHSSDFVQVSASASDLFLAGDGFWGVMMEVDNREARLLEAILAGTLFATYGTLSANREFWDISSSTLAGTATMARRVRMHCEDLVAPTDTILLEHNTSTNSLLMSYFFLTDVTHALHCGRVGSISTKELFMRMPSSPYNFHHMYNCLLSGAQPMPADLRRDEDSLILLTGICADILYLHQSFSNVQASAESSAAEPKVSPYAPLSATSEALQHHYSLDAALSRWHQHFKESTGRDLLTMYYFCRLLLASPDVLRLPHLAEYPPSTGGTSIISMRSRDSVPDISDNSVNFAWLILDHSDARWDALGPNVSIWLPVVIFYAALAIWYHLQSQQSSSNLRTGTLRTLNMFKDELAQLPWPCCAEMGRTLDRLMGNPLVKLADQGHQARR